MIERKSGDFFAAISDIKARQKAFLDYIAAFYNSTNRAVNFRLCVYHSTNSSPGCAIGQFLSPELQKLCTGSIFNVAGDPSLYNKLPAWMTEMGLQFLGGVQFLHDRPNYWNATGLTEEGRAEYAEIVVNFNLV